MAASSTAMTARSSQKQASTIAVMRSGSPRSGFERMHAVELGVEQLDECGVVIGGELFRDRLGFHAHAVEFGRRNLVDLHALGLELVDRGRGLLAADLALIVARLDRG